LSAEKIQTMSKIEQVAGTGIPLVLNDIDTDRIIPARYLRCVTFDGLGEHAFEDDRQQDPNHPFNNSKFTGASILVAGRNFGCGSSREHAPQSLMRFGISGIVAESFAEIFFGNCTSLGIPAVCADRETLDKLAAAIESDPSTEITIDLVQNTIKCGDETFDCSMPESSRDALVTGQFDFLSQLLEGESKIRSTIESVPYLSNFS
jgi:3-isopropylmalate/(R)-2-methylmalate dehydratase small subunit